MTRVSPTALATPTPRPMPIGAIAWRTTIDNTSFDRAPSAMRMPISRRCCVTACDDDAVKSKGREHDGQQREGADQPRRFLEARQAPAAQLFERAHFGERDARIDLAERFA